MPIINVRGDVDVIVRSCAQHAEEKKREKKEGGGAKVCERLQSESSASNGGGGLGLHTDANIVR